MRRPYRLRFMPLRVPDLTSYTQWNCMRINLEQAFM
ncbi:hypothetical protein CFBP6600_06690 [Xanthomonas arboricola pv. corylina]|nr:hypothetical protein CFBP6600_06690 [Xanthomonas arboricola pv. corylina]CAE6710876.1 hypothetical protein CFBP6600_06690 [Xanthomonas arboricola pv. corylina]